VTRNQWINWHDHSQSVVMRANFDHTVTTFGALRLAATLLIVASG
jgi:hypothetical protein